MISSFCFKWNSIYGGWEGREVGGFWRMVSFLSGRRVGCWVGRIRVCVGEEVVEVGGL